MQSKDSNLTITCQIGRQTKEKSTNGSMKTSQLMELLEDGAMCDAGINSAGQKVELYEFASYGKLRQFAETLGLTEAVSLLEITHNEEKAADHNVSEIAQSINIEASAK